MLVSLANSDLYFLIKQKLHNTHSFTKPLNSHSPPKSDSTHITREGSLSSVHPQMFIPHRQCPEGVSAHRTRVRTARECPFSGRCLVAGLAGVVFFAVGFSRMRNLMISTTQL